MTEGDSPDVPRHPDDPPHSRFAIVLPLDFAANFATWLQFHDDRAYRVFLATMGGLAQIGATLGVVCFSVPPHNQAALDRWLTDHHLQRDLQAAWVAEPAPGARQFLYPLCRPPELAAVLPPVPTDPEWRATAEELVRVRRELIEAGHGRADKDGWRAHWTPPV